ncbi:channel protein TolC [Spirochaetia bacterium]|nr:channel protein TolC [Spirochaetia bacterium]
MKIAGNLFLLFFISTFTLFPEPLVYEITIVQAGEMAISASQEMQTEYALRSISERTWLLGRFEYFPKLTISAYEDERLSKVSTDSFLKTYSVGIDQLVFDGGRLLSSRKIQKSQIAFQSNNLERKAAEIADTAVSAYRKILAARETLLIQEENYKALKEQRRIMASEFELGFALETDLAEADISIREADIELLTLNIDLQEMEKQFSEMLGLNEMPLLKDKIDVNYSITLPSVDSVKSAALTRNPDVLTARLSIKQKKEEAKLASLSWMPTLRANGTFTLAGNRYPLTRYNWSVGLSLDFASPWLSGKGAVSTGFEGNHEQNFRLQGSAVPFSSPASSLDPLSKKIMLTLEQTKYNLNVERIGRTAEMAVEKCIFTVKKRNIAIETLDLAKHRLRLSNLKHDLGQMTSIDLMKAQIEYAQKGTEVIQAAIAVLEAERGLEKLLDLRPGELKYFTDLKKY